MTSATLAQLSIANSIKEEAEKLKTVIEASGGAENLINDKDGMHKLISKVIGLTFQTFQGYQGSRINSFKRCPTCILGQMGNL
jgi:hypothetical protein